jgi:hypothetical protein
MQTDIVDNIIRKIKNPKDLNTFCTLNKHNYLFCKTYKNSIIKNMLKKSGVNYTEPDDNIYKFHKVSKDDYMIRGYNFPRIYKELFIPLFEGRVYYEYELERVPESDLNDNVQILDSIDNLLYSNNSKIVTDGPIDDNLIRILRILSFTRKNRQELDLKTMNVVDNMAEIYKSWSDDEYEEIGDIVDFYQDSWTKYYSR